MTDQTDLPFLLAVPQGNDTHIYSFKTRAEAQAFADAKFPAMRCMIGTPHIPAKPKPIRKRKAKPRSKSSAGRPRS